MAQIKEVIATYQPILETLPRERQSPFVVPTTVMDELTYQLVQMPDLLKTMDTSITRSGSSVLERSLRQPPTSLALVRAKQEAVREVGSDDRLRYQLEKYLHEAASPEKDFYTYFYGDYTIMPYRTHPNLYDVFRDTRKFLQFLTAGTDKIESRSEYLNLLLFGLRSFADTEIYDWVKNPIYGTPFGLRNSSRAHWYLPKRRFVPTDWKLDYYIGMGVMPGAMGFPFGVGMSFLTNSVSPSEISPLLVGLRFSALMTAMLVPFMSPIYAMMGMTRMADSDWFIQPMAKRYFGSKDVAEAVDNLGMIDELLTLVKYGERTNGPMVMPEIVDDTPHHFFAQGLRNPLMVVTDPDYVPNDVDLNGQRLTFITGPNSGGKTSLCKTIAQAQVLAQIGSPIPAEAAQIATADKVFYHAPMINSLTDEEGRFGVEVARTRDLFFQTTPRSLIILDELLEATTYEERLKHSYDILDAFWHIGNNTVLVTHNHQLAQHFKGEGRGQFWQVEFKGKKSTHKTIPGISNESHADEVMKRLGFTREKMFEHPYIQ